MPPASGDATLQSVPVMELDEELVAEKSRDNGGQDGDELEAVGRHGGGTITFAAGAGKRELRLSRRRAWARR